MTTPQPSTNDTKSKKKYFTTLAFIFNAMGILLALLIIPAVYLSYIPFAILLTAPAMLIIGVLAIILWAIGLYQGIKAIRSEETRKIGAWVATLLNGFLIIGATCSFIVATSLIFSPTTSIFSTYYSGAGFSPDGNVVAVGYKNKILLLDSKTGEKIKTLGGNKNATDLIIFSPDGNLLADSSYGRLTIRDMTTYKTLKTFTKENDRVFDFYFSPDGKLITIIWFNKGAEVISTSTFEVLKTVSFGNNFDTVYNKYISETSHHFGKTDNSEENLSVWEMNDFIENSLTKPIISIPLPQSSENTFVYFDRYDVTPDGSLLVVPIPTSIDGDYNKSEFILWNITTAELIATLEFNPVIGIGGYDSHPDPEYYFAFSPDSQTLAYINEKNNITLIDLNTFQTRDIDVEDEYVARYLAYNHDGSQILITNAKSIQMISVDSGNIVWTYP